jgi:hypothetical protein
MAFGLAGTARRPHAVRAIPSAAQVVDDFGVGWDRAVSSSYCCVLRIVLYCMYLVPALYCSIPVSSEIPAPPPLASSSAAQARRIARHVFYRPASRSCGGRGQVTSPSDRPKENPMRPSAVHALLSCLGVRLWTWWEPWADWFPKEGRSTTGAVLTAHETFSFTVHGGVGLDFMLDFPVD